MAKERIVAVGLLTQRDVSLLGQSFTRLWPVEDAHCFDSLLAAIDAAEAAPGEPDEELSKHE